jgi:2-aminoethylphosphonate-pyruvate transaminase
MTPPAVHDKPLFTPGPLTTSPTVKSAMLRDLGSRDGEFVALVRQVQRELLAVGGVSREAGYEAVIVQGSGTFAVEAVISSVVPAGGKLLVLANGAYGERILSIAKVHGIAVTVRRSPSTAPIAADDVQAALAADHDVTHVAVVHCETTTGVINPVGAIGPVVKRLGRTLIVDAMSAFGGVPTNVLEIGADYLVSSANKCIQGVPGFAFVLCRRDDLAQTRGRARTLSLDLFAQWQELEKSGQFRFTPPVQALLAFRQALRELAEEGGPPGRHARYLENRRVLVEGMCAMGFRTLLASDLPSPILTSFRYPPDPAFDFQAFYTRLGDKGFVIYPGKLTDEASFRIGTIGHLFAHDVQALLRAVADTLDEMGTRMVP